MLYTCVVRVYYSAKPIIFRSNELRDIASRIIRDGFTDFSLWESYNDFSARVDYIDSLGSAWDYYNKN